MNLIRVVEEGDAKPHCLLGKGITLIAGGISIENLAQNGSGRWSMGTCVAQPSCVRRTMKDTFVSWKEP